MSPKKMVLYKGIGFSLFLAALYALCALSSFHIKDPTVNWCGAWGWRLAYYMTWSLGLVSYLVLLLLTQIGWHLWAGRVVDRKKIKAGLWLAICLSLWLNCIAELDYRCVSLLYDQLHSETIALEKFYFNHITRTNLGGVPTYFLYQDLPFLNLKRVLWGDLPVFFLATAGIFFSFWLLYRRSARRCLEKEHKNEQSELTSPLPWAIAPLLPPVIVAPALKQEAFAPSCLAPPRAEAITTLAAQPPPPLVVSPAATKMERAKTVATRAPYSLPSPALFEEAPRMAAPLLDEMVQKMGDTLKQTLLNFGIETSLGAIHCGPAIVSFELLPAAGVKIQKIKNLENDIALNLEATSLRIVAPIPGKAAVGVEVPSPYPQRVYFRTLLEHYVSSSRRLELPLLLGKTVRGEVVISDLCKMPHLLIAGSTGSGKSVGINGIILSLISTLTPDEVKFVMIDPKRVELNLYSQLPHMLAPVITEVAGAQNTFAWLVREMEFRYEILKQLGLRNIGAFNARHRNIALEEELDIDIPEKMPYIVVIVDEFADLIMSSQADLEGPIIRLGQMARAVGIHLIIATQRPSKEVFTGLIKANLPTRIAFKVSNRTNSLIILDDIGAETLLGNGDMLFIPPGSPTMVRAQGVCISDEEIQKVITCIVKQRAAQYVIPSFEALKLEDLGLQDDHPRDTLYQQAVDLVLETQTVSASFLQRRLRIGYPRAASLVDELELKGVVTAQQGSQGKRKVLQEKIPSDTTTIIT